jgi:hypothetical protein
MVAMVILYLSMTAILDFLVTYERINIDNAMRNEAMRIAEEQMEVLRDTDFGALASGAILPYPPGVQRVIRNITVNYQVQWTVSAISATSAAIQLSVTWTNRNIQHQHRASTIVSINAI